MVMLKRRFRLRWKDVNFLVRRRNYFVNWYFGFFYWEQYPNLKFNQISVNIPLKYNKRAVKRVELKRWINSYFQRNNVALSPINWKFYKIFLSLNKNNIWELKSQLEKFDKKGANDYIIWELEKTFFKFKNKIWN